jgi:uncharacterized protein DUF3859
MWSNRSADHMALVNFVRQTRIWILLVVCFTSSFLPVIADAKIGRRSVFYSYFQAECFMWVTLAESPSGPRGEVGLVGLYAQPRRKPFRISQAEFDAIWSTLNAPGVAKRVIRRGDNPGDSYIFDDGEQKFAVSKNSDSPAISMLASRLKTYGDQARAGMMYLIPWTQVTGGELIDFGIYELKPGGGVQLVKQTDVIPARPNTNFGIRYRVAGSPKGRNTDIRVQVKHPKAVNPKTGNASTVERSTISIGIGSLDYRGVKLGGWYTVPGRWVIQIFSGAHLLLEKKFEVTAE